MWVSAFEVASVKVHPAGGGTVGIATSGARFNAYANTLKALVMYAYNLKSYQVADTPALAPLGDIFYGVAARAEDDAAPSTDAFRQMVQSLLAERFRRRAHREMRSVPVCALVQGKNGPRFPERTAGPDAKAHWASNGRNYKGTMPRATMDDVVRAIDFSRVDRPVVDKTGLTGTYQIVMTYTPNNPSNHGAADMEDVSIFAAVEKLGLRLQAENAAIEVLVVDAAEKPSGD